MIISSHHSYPSRSLSTIQRHRSTVLLSLVILLLSSSWQQQQQQHTQHQQQFLPAVTSFSILTPSSSRRNVGATTCDRTRRPSTSEWKPDEACNTGFAAGSLLLNGRGPVVHRPIPTALMMASSSEASSSSWKKEDDVVVEGVVVEDTMNGIQDLFTKNCDEDGLMTKTTLESLPFIATLLVRLCHHPQCVLLLCLGFFSASHNIQGWGVESK